MVNQLVMVGRLVSDPEIKETENGRKVTEIKLAVPRTYKNDEGIYETDFIPAILLGQVAEGTSEYCHQGDMIGVKGSLQKLKDEPLQVVAEKVTFLASSRKGK